MNSVILVNNHLDLMQDELIWKLIFGYFRANGFLDFKVRCDDFVSIICKLFIANKNIEFGKNCKTINPFNGLKISCVDAENKNFIAAIGEMSDTSRKLLSYTSIHVLHI